MKYDDTENSVNNANMCVQRLVCGLCLFHLVVYEQLQAYYRWLVVAAYWQDNIVAFCMESTLVWEHLFDVFIVSDHQSTFYPALCGGWSPSTL